MNVKGTPVNIDEWVIDAAGKECYRKGLDASLRFAPVIQIPVESFTSELVEYL